MQQRRSSPIYRRCCLAIFIASTATLASNATISAVEPTVPPMLRIPEETSGTNVQQNSTLKLRIARRPWLLEKLTTPSPKPSIKMTPPRPPAVTSDPPSMSLVVPESGSGWVTRGRVKTQVPNYADLKINPKQTDAPLVSNEEAVSNEDLDAKPLTPQTKLQGVTNKPSAATENSAQFGGVEATTPTLPSTASAKVETENAGTISPADVSETSQQSATAKKSKLELKASDSSNSESQIGEKSTATLKGGPVIVGDDEAPAENSAAIRPEQSNGSPSKNIVSPGESSASAETADQPVDDSQSNDAMVSGNKIATSNASSPATDQNQAAETKVDDVTDSKLEQESIAGASGTEIEASKATGDTTSKEDDIVKVRKLRLQADGTVTDKSGLADSETASLKAEEEAKKKPTSQFVSSDNPRATKLDYTGRPAEPIKLTRSVSRMRNTIKQGLLYHYARPEAANERSNWGMLHSIMVFGADTKIRVNNRKYSAIAWIAGNNACRGQRLLTTENDAIAARSGVGLQGHQAQFLAVMSLCDVPLDYPVYASDQKFSLREMVESEMLACRSGEELTFSLIGLSHYLDTDTIWLNADGETWSIERLIREELSQSIVGAACGGTHRLMGFAHALRKRRAAGKPITGQWKRAEIFMNDFEKYAYRLQNRDGSMSTDWFEGREDNGDMDRKIQTTGHMLEWLLTITPDAKLQEPQLVNAVRFLANTIYTERGHDWKIGPKGHALRSLAMYYERVYGGDRAWQSSAVAKSGSQSRR